MSVNSKPQRVRQAWALALLVAGAAMLLVLRANPAQAQQRQGPMSVPACQCSAALLVPGTGVKVAHCICGVMACAITEPADASSRSSSLMQCVRQ
jgi:hypothetical protein